MAKIVVDLVAMRPEGPVRSCVVCRARFPQATLLRLTRTPERGIALDGVRRAAGRGAYLCGAERCLAKARPAIRRALGSEITDAVWDELVRTARQRNVDAQLIADTREKGPDHDVR